MSDVTVIEKNTALLPTDNSPVSVMLRAINSGASLEQVEKMMDLQDRWEKSEAKKAYDTAFAAFKSEAVTILKQKKVTNGPLSGNSYAELCDVVNGVTPALSKHGLSSWWKLTRDEKDWMEVTCYLRHIGGHEESVSMGGPPDVGGAKNAIQSRASTKTYLERYTLKGITGLSEQNDDTDANSTIEQTTISDEQIERLRSAAKVAGVDDAYICKKARVRAVDQIQSSRFDAAHNHLKNLAIGAQEK